MNRISKIIFRSLIFCAAVLLFLLSVSRLAIENAQRRHFRSSARYMHFENIVEIKYIWPVQRRNPRIAILMVIEPDTKMEFYEHAMSSIACYSRVWNYDFLIVNSSDFRNECTHKDKFFRRHCVAARILGAYDYILFLDADIGVVNPTRRIEEFLDVKAEVIFYDRFYNWEVMAGAYLVKNTNWSKHFLDGFANYEFRLPKSFHGTDNGALHVSVISYWCHVKRLPRSYDRFLIGVLAWGRTGKRRKPYGREVLLIEKLHHIRARATSLFQAYLAEVILGTNDAGLATCLHVYSRSRNFLDLFMYEACIRKLLGNSTYFGKIKILPKGKAWARDNWMTNSLWNPERDFMMHNWKLTQLRTYKNAPLP
ncbi:hypothetical protein Y032_0035g3063 [Ancylostoma ceylanicum]|uniref:Nucleotide-diphospho-sugar transferase domain-containing protein n=1 Tax=Ancylostoma ceylanicum TaxID=53326 RepID=A0A016UN86_9BILA|nr:hypothetical protein Y032_0035g3063 [Ancylostoma ceylanicum]